MKYLRIVLCLLMVLAFSLNTDAKRKKVLSPKDSLQLKIDSLQTVFANIKSQYDAENEKAYLKQKYDTAKLFKQTQLLFLAAAELDSVDAKKNTTPRYRKKNAELLDSYRRNLYNGGNFFIRKNKYAEAFAYYDIYLECGSQPLFSSNDYLNTDSLMPQVAFWAVVSASLSKHYRDVLKHSDLAMKWVRQEQVLQFKAKAYNELMAHEKKYESQYLQTLKQGFLEYPEYQFFFNRMMEYYSDKAQYDSALVICDEALNDKLLDDSLQKTILFAKASIMIQQKDWDKCIPVCESLITIDSTLSTPFYYMGLCYYNRAEPLTRKDKKEKKALLNLSRKYLETYKMMAPEEKKKWGPLLYKVYFDLNLGKNFKEMDRVMN